MVKLAVYISHLEGGIWGTDYPSLCSWSQAQMRPAVMQTGSGSLQATKVTLILRRIKMSRDGGLIKRNYLNKYPCKTLIPVGMGLPPSGSMEIPMASYCWNDWGAIISNEA
jgi:hypothetical protein